MRDLVREAEPIAIRPLLVDSFVDAYFGQVPGDERFYVETLFQPRHRNDVEAEIVFGDPFDWNRQVAYLVVTGQKVSGE